MERSNGSAPRVPAFELRDRDIIVNATRLEQYHQKSVTTKPTTPHFRAPRMVSTISVSTVIAASLDSRRARARPAAEREARVKKRIVNPGAASRATRSPLPLQGEASVGVPHRATLLTPQQDVVKHAAWEIRTCRKHCPCQQLIADAKYNAASFVYVSL